TRSPPNDRIYEKMVAGVVAGAYTRTATLARAPYAEAAMPALPAVGSTNDFAPAATALVTAALIPRDLNEPVGLDDSSFTSNPASPVSSPSLPASRRGVPPSPSVIGSSPGSSGRWPRY